MTKLKWSYVARGHYSSPVEKGEGTVHVLEDGAVFITQPSRATKDVTGSKAERYIESAQEKFPVRGKKRAKPKPEPEEEKVTPLKVTTKPTPKPKKKGVTKKDVGEAAKTLAKGAGAIIGTTRAFVSIVGEEEERAYAKRRAAPPKKKAKKKVKPPKRKPPTSGRPTIVRKKKVKPPSRMAPETQHPLEYLMTGTGALPPTGRKRPTKKAREQTLEEYLGF